MSLSSKDQYESPNEPDQNIKIIFLNKEIQQLNDKIMDLEEMLNLNKEALKSALNNKFEQKTNSERKLSNENELSSCRVIIMNLQKENEILTKNIEKINKERNICQTQVLLHEQMSEASHKRELEVIKDYEKKIRNLYAMVSEKEQRIDNLEKMKPSEIQDGVIIQNREILGINEQVVKIHNEYELQKVALVRMVKEMAKLHEEKEELLSINYNLANEINKLKSSFRSRNSMVKKDEHLEKEENVDSAFLNFQKKFVAKNSSSEEDIDQDCEIIQNLQENEDKDDLKKKKNLSVPKLDLTRAKKIQEQNIKKIAQIDKKNEKIPEDNQITLLEGKLENSKKMLQKEMCENTIISKEIENLKKENRSLKNANDSLISMHKNFEEKWLKINNSFKFYKLFYESYLDKIFHHKCYLGFLNFLSFYFPNMEIENFYFNKDILEIYEYLKNTDNLIDIEDNQFFDFDVFNDFFELGVFSNNENKLNKNEEKEKYKKIIKKINNELINKLNNNESEDKKLQLTKQKYILHEFLSMPIRNKKRSMSCCLDNIPSFKKTFFNDIILFYNEDLLNYKNFKNYYLMKENEENKNEIDLNNFEDYNESKYLETKENIE